MKYSLIILSIVYCFQILPDNSVSSISNFLDHMHTIHFNSSSIFPISSTQVSQGLTCILSYAAHDTMLPFNQNDISTIEEKFTKLVKKIPFHSYDKKTQSHIYTDFFRLLIFLFTSNHAEKRALFVQEMAGFTSKSYCYTQHLLALLEGEKIPSNPTGKAIKTVEEMAKRIFKEALIYFQYNALPDNIDHISTTITI